MLVQAGQEIEQRSDECFAEFAGWPFFKYAEIEHVADDWKVGVNTRPDEDVCTDDFHIIVFLRQLGAPRFRSAHRKSRCAA